MEAELNRWIEENWFWLLLALPFTVGMLRHMWPAVVGDGQQIPPQQPQERPEPPAGPIRPPLPRASRTNQQVPDYAGDDFGPPRQR